MFKKQKEKRLATDFDYIGIIDDKIMILKEKPNFKSFISFDEDIFLFHDIKTGHKYKMNEFKYIQKINDIELEELKVLIEKYKSQKEETNNNKKKSKKYVEMKIK